MHNIQEGRPNVDKIVLMPTGPVQGFAARERCDTLLLRCGADLRRVFDKPISSSFDQYVRYISRIDDVRIGSNPPIIVITKISALVLSVINLRRKLNDALPNLQRSLWTIFVDLDASPFFENEAQGIGSLNDELDNAPIWSEEISRGGYLILTSRTRADGLLLQRVAKLLARPIFSRKASSSFRISIPSSSTNKP